MAIEEVTSGKPSSVHIYTFEETEEKCQDGNDLICLFLGATLKGKGENEMYYFPKGVCPPFDCIPRWYATKRCMRFHECYDWLMPVIKKCWENATTDELKSKYYDIVYELTNFNMILPLQNTQEKVVEFIKLYNSVFPANS